MDLTRLPALRELSTRGRSLRLTHAGEVVQHAVVHAGISRPDLAEDALVAPPG